MDCGQSVRRGGAVTWNDFPYDLESYPNVFSAVIVHAASGTEWIFEVSDRVNQSRQLLNFVRTLGQHPGNRMVGYNNAGSDTHTRTVRYARTGSDTRPCTRACDAVVL